MTFVTGQRIGFEGYDLKIGIVGGNLVKYASILRQKVKRQKYIGPDTCIFIIFKFSSVLFQCTDNSIMIDLKFLLLNVLVSQYP